MKTACWTSQHSRRNFQYIDFTVFPYQSGDIAEDSKSVGWVKWWLRRYGCLEVSFWLILIRKDLWFVGEIQAMIDNDPSRLINFFARDMGVCAFLIRQVVHEDIYYFSNKIRKGTRMTWEKTTLQRFSSEEKFFRDQMMNSTVDTRHRNINENQTHSPRRDVWSAIDVNVMPSFIFPHGFILNYESHIKCLEKVVLTWIVVTSGHKTLYKVTPEREPSVGCEKISVIISPRTFAAP